MGEVSLTVEAYNEYVDMSNSYEALKELIHTLNGKITALEERFIYVSSELEKVTEERDLVVADRDRLAVRVNELKTANEYHINLSEEQKDKLEKIRWEMQYYKGFKYAVELLIHSSFPDA